MRGENQEERERDLWRLEGTRERENKKKNCYFLTRITI